MPDDLLAEARKFVDKHVSLLPLPVRLNGITEAEKVEAAEMCANFTRTVVKAERERIADEIETAYATLNSKLNLADWLMFDADNFLLRLREGIEPSCCETRNHVDALTKIIPLAQGMYDSDGSPVARVILAIARESLRGETHAR